MGRADAEMDPLPEKIKPPDGGWGWIVLLGCFVITGFSYAFPKAVSVYFKELMYDFHVGYSDTAWISSIMLAMLYGTGKEANQSYGTTLLCLQNTCSKRDLQPEHSLVIVSECDIQPSSLTCLSTGRTPSLVNFS